MKVFSRRCLYVALFAFAVNTAIAQEPLVQPGILEVGDRLRIQALGALMDEPDELTVLKFGPRAWVLLEYTRQVTPLPGGPAVEVNAPKHQMWVNFEHVIAVKKLPKVAEASTGSSAAAAPAKAP